MNRPVLVLALLAAACTTGSNGVTDAGYTPTFAPTECPGPVTASASRETTCGYLTVPENRSNPAGPQVHLFVVRIAPDKPTAAPPVVYAGSDLGTPTDYYALSGMADHLDGPEVIGLEPRGTGFSEPNLSCPEVDAISSETITIPIADPDLRQAFVAAVRACHDRFAAQGIDLSAYNVQEAGRDVLDLVRTLRLEEWDVVTKGSMSRVVVEAMRSNPPGMRAFVAYNPEFPDTDSFAQAIEGTRTAVSGLETLCDADPTCARRFPDLATTFDATIRRFDDHPRTIRLRGKEVPIDGARLLRDLRNLLASVDASGKMYLHLPATIDALAHAKDPTSAISAVVSPELTAPTFCTGYVPVCDPPTSQGAYYSALCADIAPFTDAAALASLAGREAAWTQDYVEGPYNDVCGAWQVEPADDAVTVALQSDVPVLVFGGGLDPTVTPEAIRSGIARLSNALFIVTPTWGYAPSAIPPCPEAQPRSEFLADPTSAPNTRCQERFQPTFARSPL
ncbi:MAG: alpha/beta hydrolase [Actinomycetota bacterium]